MGKRGGEQHSRTPIDPRIGERIRTFRRRAGLSQDQLSTQANVSFAVVSRLECGKQSVSAERLHAIARALGIPVSLLYADEAAQLGGMP